jgi:hypothetical protein
LFDFAAVDELKRPAANRGKSLPQLALRSTLSNPIVGTALVGFCACRRAEKCGCARLGNQQGRYGRDRRYLRASPRYNIAAGLARRLAHCVTIG